MNPIKSTITSIITDNYHNDTVEFKIGQDITYVDDDGKMYNATISKIILPDELELIFKDDGKVGTVLASACF